MNTELNIQAESIANAAAPAVGFDPFIIMTIVTTLIPLLTSCFKSASAQTPAEYLADHWDEADQSFDNSLVNRVRPQTRRAARQQWQGRLTRQQLDAITVSTLEHARTADAATVGAVMTEADATNGQ